MTARLTLEERQAKRERDHRGCGGKKRFPSRKTAIAGALRASSEYPVDFYKCRVCRGFHLTKRRS